MNKSQPQDRAYARLARRRRGFTMLEILTSVTLALMLMYAVARIFSRVGGAMNETTSIMQMTNSLRNTKNRLTEDLEALTLIPQPPANSQLGQGYLCYVEGLGGPLNQVSATNGALAPFSTADSALDTERLEAYGAGDPLDYVDSTVGDLDDIVSFTAKAPADKPFRGRYLRPVVNFNPDGSSYIADVEEDLFESEFAEIIWFVRGTTLYRRVLPIMDDKELQDSLNAFEIAVANGGAIAGKLAEGIAKNYVPGMLRAGYAFFRFYDVSVHTEYEYIQYSSDRGGYEGRVHANTLGDLGDRANRYGYWNSFGRIHNPYPSDPNRVKPVAYVNGVEATFDRYFLPDGQGDYAKLYSQFSIHGPEVQFEDEPNIRYPWYWLRMPTLQESASWTFRAGYPFGDTQFGMAYNPRAPYENSPNWYGAGSDNQYRWIGVQQTLSFQISNDDARAKQFGVSGLFASPNLPFLNSANSGTSPQPFVDYWNNPNFWDQVDPETGDLNRAVLSTDSVFNQDVALTNVISFNVKAWDPRTNSYVDLGSGVANGDSVLDNPNDLRSAGRYVSDGIYNLTLNGNNYAVPMWTRTPCVYDTWTEAYQTNFASFLAENGNNADVSDIPSNAPISSAMLPDYPPPYDVPLKGLQIEIRVFDPRSKTIRNSTFNVDLTKR